MTFSTLQILSFAFAITVLLYIIWLDRFRVNRVSNGQRLVVGSIILALLILGINPDSFNSLLNAFSFEAGNGGRLIGLSILAIFILFLGLIRSQVQITELHDTLNQLVREMARQTYHNEAGEPETEETVYVIIPAYNEEENIGAVLERLPDTACGLPVRPLVIVDGGTDATETVVRSYGEGVAATHIINRGGGAALHLGYDIALDKHAAIIVTIDADGQHQPEEIEKFVQPILNNDADFVNGSRVLGVYEKDQPIRAAGVVFFNLLISILLWQRITDCSNGYRAISREALAAIRPSLMQRQYHTTESLIETVLMGYRLIEVPVTVTKRMSGESKKGPTWSYALGFTRAILTTWLR